MGRFVFTVAIAVWLGTLVSFSYVFLPSIHGALQGPAARQLLQRLFPHYYLTGIVCGLIALGAVSIAPESPTLPLARRLGLALPVALALLCALTTRQVLLPRLASLDSTAQPDAYQRMHQIAAMLNTTVLAMLVLVLAAVITT